MRKSRTKIFYFLLTILFTSCYNSVLVDEFGTVWKKTNCNLWISQNGKLALQSFDVSDMKNKKNVFIDHFSNGKPLNGLIDTITFRYLGNYFYKDKNHVYNHNSMADGGHFLIVEEADSKTFIILGNFYGKDKTSIYSTRDRKLDLVDYATFKTSSETDYYAKDKNGYCNMGEKIDTINADDELKKIIQKLEKL